MSQRTLLSSYYRQSQASGPALRVGLLMDGMVASAVVARIVEDIQQSNFAAVELVILNDACSDSPSNATWRSRLNVLLGQSRRSRVLFSQSSKWDRTSAQQPEPTAPVDCAPLLGNVPALHVTPHDSGLVHRIEDSDLADIAAYKLDVIVKFGFKMLQGDITSMARYGLWSYHHSDDDTSRGGAPLFWDITENSPESGVVLEALNEHRGLVLRRSTFASEPGFQWGRSAFGPLWATQHFVIEQLWQIHNFGWEHVRAKAQAPDQNSGADSRTPAHVPVTTWIAPVLARKLAKKVRSQLNPTRKHWRIGLRPLPSSDSALAEALYPNDFTWLNASPGTWMADPVLFEWEGYSYLFAEEFDETSGRGRLSVAPVTGGADLKFETCLEEPFHLSYPLVFAHGGHHYMIPETLAAGEVRLYIAEQFPLRWKLHNVMLRLPAVDTTPFFDGTTWWLFVTTCEPDGYCPSLLLFHSNSLHGPWIYHPANPISSDLDTVRNAGPIFCANGRVFRPSQSRKGGYGRSFSLNEIIRLTPTAYEERQVMTTMPKGMRGIVGTHTYGRSSHWETIDGLFIVPIEND